MYWGIDLTYEINKSTDCYTDQGRYLRFLVPRNDRIAGNKLNVVISTKGDIWRFLVPRNDRIFKKTTDCHTDQGKYLKIFFLRYDNFF